MYVEDIFEINLDNNIDDFTVHAFEAAMDDIYELLETQEVTTTVSQNNETYYQPSDYDEVDIPLTEIIDDGDYEDDFGTTIIECFDLEAHIPPSFYEAFPNITTDDELTLGEADEMAKWTVSNQKDIMDNFRQQVNQRKSEWLPSVESQIERIAESDRVSEKAYEIANEY